MEELQNKISKLKKLIDNAERKKIQLDTRKEEALKTKSNLEKKCLEYNIKLSDLQNHIAKLENSISNSLKKFDDVLSAVDKDDFSNNKNLEEELF